jgi:glycosyltransferase involved in cell wall biosynthesis
MLNRFYDKFSYLLLLISLQTGYLLAYLAGMLAFLIKPRKPNRQLILFPYAQKGSDGYTRRFEEYFPFLKRDQIDFFVCDVIHNDELLLRLNGTKPQRYKLFHDIFWKRFKQVLQARHYQYCFVHRSLFLVYPDQRFPHLERLLFKLHDRIIVDVWDAVWVYMPHLSPLVPYYCHRMCVVNEFLKSWYQQRFPEKKIDLFPIGVNLKKYIVRQHHEIEDEVRLFYTGSPYNVNEFLKITGAVLRALAQKYSLRLVYVSREQSDIDYINTEWHAFDETTFFQILASCHIGVYAFKNNDEGKGKMAMKVLDYMAAGLPAVAYPAGLSPHAVHEENILIADTPDGWGAQLERLVTDASLRQRLGSNARKMMEQYHDISASYQALKKIIFLTD